MLVQRLLVLLLQAPRSSFLTVAAEIASDDAELARKASEGRLKQKLESFQLTGGYHADMEEISGGGLCVDAFGKEPAGYSFHGPISLEDCAHIAQHQPRVLGFKWGAYSFQHEEYRKYAYPKAKKQPVDLKRLFGGATSFTCVLFVEVRRYNDQPQSFHETNLTASLGIRDPRPKDGPAERVCYQRWTLMEFLKPHIQELWFCYMPSSVVDACEKETQTFYLEGKVFVGIFLCFLGILGFIIGDLPEFEIPLVWFTRLLVHMELGLACVAFFIRMFPDKDPWFVCSMGYLCNVLVGNLLFVPYWIMESIQEDSPFNTAYLLGMAFSPAFLCEFMSYYSGFVTLVSHYPLLVGTLAFFTSGSINYYAENRSLREDAEALSTRALNFGYRLVPQQEDHVDSGADKKLVVDKA